MQTIRKSYLYNSMFGSKSKEDDELKLNKFKLYQSMFGCKSNKSDNLELNQFNKLNIPALEECCYTSCFCEENVWKLCELVKKHQPNLLPQCYAVFISNRNQSVPLWNQRSGIKDQTYLAVWDYHVIFLFKTSNNDSTLVYDLDTILSFPSEIENYASMTFQNEAFLTPNYYRNFRVVPAAAFLSTFASDRSRMKNSDGSWIKDPPPYPCIYTSESTNNIDDFISMDQSVGIGEVLSLQQFLNRFQ